MTFTISQNKWRFEYIWDTKEITCVYCGALNHSEDENCITCLNKLNIQESLIGHKLNSYELTKYIARGFYGLTYKTKKKTKEEKPKKQAKPGKAKAKEAEAGEKKPRAKKAKNAEPEGAKA